MIAFSFFAAFLLGAKTAFSQIPVISSFEPAKAFYDEIITIKGTGFASKADLQVKFGSATAKITESNSTAIRVMVPTGATYAPISVRNLPSGLTAYSNQPFVLSFGGLEDGDVTFDPSKTYPGTGVSDVCACDLDGDGKNDLVGSNPNSTYVSSYLNAGSIGNIHFPSRKEIYLGSRSAHLTCGDLDGDGKADLVFTGNATDGEKVIILKNTSTTGNISFAAPQVLTVSSKVLAKPAIQDLDGDGKPEIVLTNQTDEQVVVFKNTSVVGNIHFDSNFLPFTVEVPSLQGLRIKDVDKDGLADITVSNLYGEKVFFLLNNSTPGNIRFQSPIDFNASGLTNHELEDMDGDGKNDLITLDYFSSSVNIHLNNSEEASLSFSAGQSFATATFPTGMELGDLNGDQKVDILIGHNTEAKAHLLINTSTEGILSFKPFVLSGNGKFTNVQISDFDGDAIPDVAVADKENGIFYVFRNSTCIYPGIHPFGDVELCEGSSVTLSTVQSPKAEGEAPSISYQWLKNGEAIGTGYSITTSTSGNYSVKMTSTEKCSITSETVKVRIFSQEGLGNPTFDPVTNACEGQALRLSVSPAPEEAIYTWTNNASGYEETTTTNALTIEAADPALHAGSFTLTIAKGPCQISIQSPEITLQPKPDTTVTADGSLSICAGENRTLSAAEGYSAYQWKKDGEPISGATSASYTARQTGSYSVMVTNTNGCEAESEATILEVQESLQAKFDGPTAACVGYPVQFTDQSTVATGKAAEYLWDFGDGTASSDPSPTHTYSHTGSSSFTVTLTVKYENTNCSSTYSRIIPLNDTPDVTIEVSGPREFCAGDSVKVQVSGDAAEVKWSNGGSGLFTYAKEGGSLQAEVLTPSGCIITKSFEFTKLPTPKLELTADKTTIAKGESAHLQVSGGTSYRWEPAESLDNPTIANPVASPAETTTYTVTVVGEHGCSTEAEITIRVEGGSFNVQAPKLFVPANDQTWTVPNIEDYPDVSLTILNKFGRPVFEAFPYENNWSGTDKGNQLPEGVYYYVFKDASGSVIKSGSITIVR